MKSVSITYFSDILCIWAYIAQLRLDAIERSHGPRVRIDYRFCNVFGDTARKVGAGWAAKGGYPAFNDHIRHAASSFPEISIDPGAWLGVKPASSMGAHVWLKALQLAEREESVESGAAERVMRGMRDAFFRQARDISDWKLQTEIVGQCGVDPRAIEPMLRDGRALAALSSDYQDADAFKIQGSPTFILNEGRQKLYGNVGYRIIDANIQELLREPHSGEASWC